MPTITVAKASDTPPGTISVHEANGVRIALCNVNGRFYAIDDVCTHDGGPLDQGELQENLVECPRHGAKFDVTTGGRWCCRRCVREDVRRGSRGR